MILTAYLCDSLDALGIAACEFDLEHRTTAWNRTFTEFFPEHAAHVHVGEPYAENLRRFYRGRLGADEVCEIERYVAEGIARHQNQTQPYEFTHRHRRLRVSSLEAPGGSRLRLWQQIIVEGATPRQPAPVFDALEYIPDGATILSADDRILATNAEFRRLYDIPHDRVIVGLTLDEIIAEAWRFGPSTGALRATIRNGLRYDGAPFEVELPGNRWRRVIVRHADDGLGYFTHADITANKRQQQEILEAQEALRRANAELSRLATTDALTGLANRRRFADALAVEAARQQSLGLILVDVDHFKAINDRFGHPAGDACLNSIAAAIAAVVPAAKALVARIGGEEFGVVLSNTGLTEARSFAAGIRQAVASLPWSALQTGLDKITISVGVCAGPGPLDPAEMQLAADRALYVAKRAGRDRVEVVTLNSLSVCRRDTAQQG